MIDRKREELRNYPQISKEHPIHPSVATLWRWTLKGIKGQYFESLVYGGRRYSSLEAVDRFAALLSGLRSANGPQVSRRRQEEMARAEKQTKDIFRTK